MSVQLHPFRIPATSDMSSADHYDALRERAGLIDASDARGRLVVSGADRRSYLQGLLTNDIVSLSAGTGCYSAYLTAQGRMIADMRVFELGDSLLVSVQAGVTDTVNNKWGMFIFSEDVLIEDRSAATAELGIYGPQAAHVLSTALAAGEAVPAPSPERLESMPLYACATISVRGQSVVLLRTDDEGAKGFDVVVPVEARGEWLARLEEAGAVRVAADAVEVCRVEAGRPRFGIDMTEDTIPLEAGIEDRAISLTKGCYVGQEVIIRVLHRGHGRVARRLVGLSLDPAAGVPARGARIRVEDRDVGAVTSAVRSAALGRPIALGYVHRDFTTPGTRLSIDAADAEVAALPFV
jgi:folate-binding protein YgfZ